MIDFGCAGHRGAELEKSGGRYVVKADADLRTAGPPTTMTN